MFGAGQTHFAQCLAGGRDRSAGTEQAQKQRLGFLAKATLIASRQRGRAELAAPSARNLDLDRHRSNQQRARIKAIGLVLGLVLQISTAFRLGQVRKHRPQELAQTEIC